MHICMHPTIISYKDSFDQFILAFLSCSSWNVPDIFLHIYIANLLVALLLRRFHKGIS